MKRDLNDRMIDAVNATLNGMDPALAALVYDIPYEVKEPTPEEQKAIDYYDTLSDEDKADLIEVNGRTYVRKMWEYNHGGER